MQSILETARKVRQFALIILDVGAGMVYGAQGDYKKLIYWLTAATLNIVVTF